MRVENSSKKLPINEHEDVNNYITDSVCWKREEARAKNMIEAFKAVKYIIFYKVKDNFLKANKNVI